MTRNGKHLSGFRWGGAVGKGLGQVQRRLRDLFVNNPRGVFTTEGLCRHVYPGVQVRKKHRVAVLRAMKRLAQDSMPTLWRKVQRFERDDLWYDYRFFPEYRRDRGPAGDRRPPKP